MSLPEQNDPQLLKSGRRHLRWFSAVVAIILTIVVGVNAATFAIVSQPANARLGQLIDGWGRIYKPVLADATHADVMAFGASWVRDAFDPKVLNERTGKTFFNMGVSGGTAYEAHRFLQSALAKHKPQAVVLNLNSYGDGDPALRAGFGFNEDILNVDAFGQLNRLVAIQRAYHILFSGAALGFGANAIKAWWELRQGMPVDAVLAAYDHFDYTAWLGATAYLARMSQGEKIRQKPNFPPKRGGFIASFETLKKSVDLACQNSIDVHVYATAHHMLASQCTKSTSHEKAALKTLRELSQTCQSRITFHYFEYPNALTMEGVWNPVDRSAYYRFDGHPRPPLGTLMMSRMLDLPQTDVPADLDFGIDLLSLDDEAAGEWLTRRKARCAGDWQADDLAAAKAHAIELSKGP